MDDADRATLLAVVAQVLGRFDAQMLSYCLMSVAAGRDVDLWAEGLRRQIDLGDDESVLQKMLDAATPTARRSASVPKPQRSAPRTLKQRLARCDSREEALRCGRPTARAA